MAVALCHAPWLWLHTTNAMPGMTDLKLICFHQCSLLQLRSAGFAVQLEAGKKRLDGVHHATKQQQAPAMLFTVLAAG